MREDVTMDAKSETKLLALTMKEEAVSQGMQSRLRSWKRQRNGSFQSLQRNEPCQYLDLSPVRPRTGKEYVCVVYTTKFVAFCYSSVGCCGCQQPPVTGILESCSQPHV